MVICSRRLAVSPTFSAITTVLTIYALFGDDMRLLLTEKPNDGIFDSVTITSMVIFSIEIIACSFGKAGYLFGFFFWLDILSTITLVFDITTVAESLFGDSISRLGDKSAGGRNDGAGNSAETARAARMSRAGTKAGRVVRLIRLVRLMKLVRIKSRAQYQEGGPKEHADWEDDGEEHDLDKESAVSKKLSEMTTRRVIMLVLIIMLALPLFQPTMYGDRLPSSAQYGMNVLYRRWSDDMNFYQPLASPQNKSRYLASRNRQLYEDDFYMYAYFHNAFCKSKGIPDGKVASPLDSFGRLFWLGASPLNTNMTEFFLPSTSNSTLEQLNARWEGRNWLYYSCKYEAKALEALRMQWNQTTNCVSRQSPTIRGVSLISFQEPRVGCPEDLRFQERLVMFPMLATTQEQDALLFMFVFDKRSGSSMEAALNTAQTIFICCLLGFGAMTFSNDANKLVLMPIERMISKLEKIRNNPLEAMTIGDEEHHREQAAAMRKNRYNEQEAEQNKKETKGNSRWWPRLPDRIRRGRSAPKQAPEPMETVVLEKTIIKIGSLLALGFGEAGAEIIGQNMKGSDSSALNAMIPGRKVEAIFGFCDIRNFTDATEVLQDQVMVFVNRIAAVVHQCIHDFFGSPNKNVGDAFLLVWRLSGFNESKQRRLADMSLMSFVKIIAQISKSSQLAEYRNHPKLVKRLPNYRVRMGFGLHSGWAIEGAIGSEFKIDASYLSPNVNMAARLEACTKQYGSSILVSEMLQKLLSEPFGDECRLIDNIVLSGSNQNFKLYTVDLDDMSLDVERITLPSTSKTHKFRARMDRQKKRAEKWQEEFNLFNSYESDPDVKRMRKKYSEEFFLPLCYGFP